jgi:hypothetical protein
MNGHGPDCGNNHEHILVEELAAPQGPQCTCENAPSGQQIGKHYEGILHPRPRQLVQSLLNKQVSHKNNTRYGDNPDLLS